MRQAVVEEDFVFIYLFPMNMLVNYESSFVCFVRLFLNHRLAHDYVGAGVMLPWSKRSLLRLNFVRGQAVVEENFAFIYLFQM